VLPGLCQGPAGGRGVRGLISAGGASSALGEGTGHSAPLRA
jgi:hypothetical protein